MDPTPVICLGHNTRVEAQSSGLGARKPSPILVLPFKGRMTLDRSVKSLTLSFFLCLRMMIIIVLH